MLPTPSIPQNRSSRPTNGRATPPRAKALELVPSDEQHSSTASHRTPLRRWLAGFRGRPQRKVTSFLVSLIVHALAMIVLALIIPAVGNGRSGVSLVIDAHGETELPAVPDNHSVSIEQFQADAAPRLADTLQQLQSSAIPTVSVPFAVPAAVPAEIRPSDDASSIPSDSLLVRSTLPTGGGLEGRTRAQRARLAGERGGTAGSESAVEMALAWLAAHQRQDGSWSLRFDDPPCQDQCTNGGTMETNTGATALAMLPFLGAGYTHKEGPYQELVKRGLYFLTSRMIETPHGGDLHENITMYSQGLAALVFCETYAMTGDENLRPYAQKSVDFICYAQHPRGGWRYFPGQPGDATVTAWQVMALKSARLARLSVPTPVMHRVEGFLDSLQEANGAFYGYQTPDKLPGPTAVGLLLRMYQGWARDDERLMRGATWLGHLGPSKQDVYFDYYATQVMHHMGGPMWSIWNPRMREYLVSTQSKNGHERGSWFFPDKHGSVGGRLYTTAMAVMILEVYYRYMPLYGNDAVFETF